MADIGTLQGIGAYQQKLDAPGAGEKSGNAGSFAEMLSHSIEDSVDTLKAVEVASEGALTGEVSLEELATAVANAEITLQTITAVRDRLVNAYQDIIKMPI